MSPTTPVETTYYELLTVGADAAAEDIKAAFRREIARYHPDKVAHLGPEFLRIAEARASELTEAYRTLMDPAARAAYDEQLKMRGPREVPAGDTPATETADVTGVQETASSAASFTQERVTGNDFLRRASVARFSEAVAAALHHADVTPARGFDAAYVARPKRNLLAGHQDPVVRVLGRFVATVDPAAVEETWELALRAAGISGHLPAVFLMGSGLAAPGELGACISDLKRRHVRHPSAPPVVVPVDVRDWHALVPTEAPSAVRQIIQKLRNPV